MGRREAWREGKGDVFRQASQDMQSSCMSWGNFAWRGWLAKQLLWKLNFVRKKSSLRNVDVRGHSNNTWHFFFWGRKKFHKIAYRNRPFCTDLSRERSLIYLRNQGGNKQRRYRNFFYIFYYILQTTCWKTPALASSIVDPIKPFYFNYFIYVTNSQAQQWISENQANKEFKIFPFFDLNLVILFPINFFNL